MPRTGIVGRMGNLRASARLLLAVAIGAVGLGLPASPAAADVVVPGGITESVVLDGLTQPTSVAFAPDGAVFITEKAGRVKRIDGIGDTTPSLVLDLRNRVHNNGDRGLMSIAVHPDWPANRSVFVAYTLDRLPSGGPIPAYGNGGDYDPCPDAASTGCPARSVVSRIDLGGAPSETVLFEGHCQQFPFHSIGDLGFDAAGNLLVSFGDGSTGSFVEYGQRGNICGDPPGAVGDNLTAPTTEGGQARSLDLLTRNDPTGPHGALLRVDPDTFDAVPGNPLAGDGEEMVERMLAIGFRNPFRFAIDPGSDRVFVGNVGGAGFEEIQEVRTGSPSITNGGWPCYEGPGTTKNTFWLTTNLCTGLIASGEHDAPLFSYTRPDPVTPGEPCPTGGLSISGLAVNSVGFGPSALHGGLFFTDYTRDCIWYLPADGNGGVRGDQPTLFATGAGLLVDLGFGPDGDLYGLDIAGRLVRYSDGDEAAPPVARIESSTDGGPAPLTVTFDGRMSSDPNGDTLRFRWDLGNDGTIDGTADQITTTYNENGTQTVRLLVLDDGGLRDEAIATVIVGDAAPDAEIVRPAMTDTFAVGDEVRVEAAAAAGVPDSAYAWELILHHCIPGGACHTHGLDGRIGRTATFEMPDHEWPSEVEMRLTVSGNGLTSTATRTIGYETTELHLWSEPWGARIQVGSTEEATPFTRTVAVGATTSISIDGRQEIRGESYDFTWWRSQGSLIGSMPGIELRIDRVTNLTALLEPAGGPEPSVCRATADGADATISWDAVGGASDYRIFRSIDDGARWWRGRVTGTSFQDVLRSPVGLSHAYEVEARVGGVWQAPIVCAPALVSGGGGDGRCWIDADGTDALVRWSLADADEVRIFRSADGAGPYWRGRVGVDVEFVDPLRTGVTFRYEIDWRRAGGAWSDRLDCTPEIRLD